MSDAGLGPTAPHLPVLYQEIIHALDPKSPGHYIDGTVGAGGHSFGILQASAPEGHLLGLDLDLTALELARQRLAIFGDRAILRQASYTQLVEQMASLGWVEVQGILLDLGVSSMQLDDPQRGFSFQAAGPLDMRFNASAGLSAADLVNNMPEAELADLIWRYGEERNSRHIARAIVRARPIKTTRQLADLIARVSPSKTNRIHPATRTFQALRITVNDELKSVETVLPVALSALGAGGRLAVIAFHSLEDRIVKQFFHQESRDCICPPDQPICTCGHKASLIEITRHPIMATEAEIQQNARARSARLRVAQKI